MERFDRVFDKLNGGYICFIIVTISTVLGYISSYFYLPLNPSYSMFTNYVSDMGAGPIETKITIAVSNTLIGIFLMPLFVFIVRDLEKKDSPKDLKWTILVVGFITSIATILSGFFLLDPADPVAYEVHKILGIIYFCSIAIVMLVYRYLELKLPDFSKLLVIFSIITGILALIFMIGFVIVEYTILPRHALVYFVEHMTFNSLAIWLIAHGIFFLKNK